MKVIGHPKPAGSEWAKEAFMSADPHPLATLVPTDLGIVTKTLRQVGIDFTVEQRDFMLRLELDDENGEPDSGWVTLDFTLDGKFKKITGWP